MLDPEPGKVPFPPHFHKAAVFNRLWWMIWLNHSLKLNNRHGGQWGLRGRQLMRSYLRLEWLRGKKISCLALFLNSLPRVLGVRAAVTFYNCKRRSRYLYKQNHHLPWASAFSNSEEQQKFCYWFFFNPGQTESSGRTPLLTDQDTFQESMGIFPPFHFYIHSWEKDFSSTHKNV